MEVIMESILEPTDTSKSEKMHTEFEELKSGFSQLRSDVMNLVSHAMGFGRNGAGVAKESAAEQYENLKNRFADLKERGAYQLDAVSKQVEEHPLGAAMVAFGIGFVFAKLMHRRH
jgi:ElaB/YqjD/DUF883 family membrane-anchored ribosome-binding protein